MSALLRRLDVRMFASYALVALVGGATFVATVHLVAPPVFDDHVHMMGHRANTAAHDALSSALDTALPVALLASVLAAAVSSAFVARRILRPVGAVQQATRRLAAGHYDERVPLPRETELAALAADVNTLAASLESTERRRVELISEVAHELRTPLTTITGYVEGMVDGVFAPSDEVLVAVNEEVTRLQRLAEDLSSLSKLDEGALHLRLEPADLTELTTRVAARLRPQFDDKTVTLTVDAAAGLAVDADADRVVQILTNLLGNALTYTPAGGRVTVTARAEAGAAIVEITDSGVGLSPDELDHVFERFYRAPGVERPPGGSGIGLTIARSLARAHGGEITARSPGRGRGATFTLRLPVRAG